MSVADNVFAAKFNEPLIHQVLVSYMAGSRSGTKAQKSRSEVRGGGKKPWRQKGTGRARSGSSRSPVWVGGGTVFGPQPRSYAYRLPRSARRTALLAALAHKQRDGNLTVVNEIVLTEPKTKQMIQFLYALGLTKSILIVITDPDHSIERSARNLPHVKVLRSEGLNVYDLLRYHHCLFTRDSLEQVSKGFAV